MLLPARHARTATFDADYAQRLQCQRQWRGFLSALAQELSEALPAQENAVLMARIGTRFALQHPLAPSETLTGLQQAMNAVWDRLDWGQVELSQSDASMHIYHRFSPLAAAFGETEAGWAAGFLQGAYQQWLEAAGAGGLSVQVASAPDAAGNVELLLAAA